MQQIIVRKRTQINIRMIFELLAITVAVYYIISMNIKLREQKIEISTLKADAAEAAIEYDNQSKLVNQYISELRSIDAYCKELETAINTASGREDALKNTISDLDKQLSDTVAQFKVLSKQYDELESNYDGLRKRKELYDKYSYAIFDAAGKRTTLSYSDIEYGETLMKKYGYSPHILFGIMGAESGYDAKAKNASSTARGLGQVLEGTAKYVYEDILHKGNYSHEMAYNAKTNILITASYLNYLMDTTHNNLFATIQKYSGRNKQDTYAYLRMINRAYQNKQTINQWLQ